MPDKRRIFLAALAVTGVLTAANGCGTVLQETGIKTEGNTTTNDQDNVINAANEYEVAEQLILKMNNEQKKQIVEYLIKYIIGEDSYALPFIEETLTTSPEQQKLIYFLELSNALAENMSAEKFHKQFPDNPFAQNPYLYSYHISYPIRTIKDELCSCFIDMLLMKVADENGLSATDLEFRCAKYDESTDRTEEFKIFDYDEYYNKGDDEYGVFGDAAQLKGIVGDVQFINRHNSTVCYLSKADSDCITRTMNTILMSDNNLELSNTIRYIIIIKYIEQTCDYLGLTINLDNPEHQQNQDYKSTQDSINADPNQVQKFVYEGDPDADKYEYDFTP